MISHKFENQLNSYNACFGICKAYNEIMPSTKVRSNLGSESDLEQRVIALEKEVEVMKKNAKIAKPKKDYKRLRFWSSAILIVLASLFFVFSIAGYWLKNNIVNTSVWVAKSNEVIRDESVRKDISNSLTNTIFEKVDVNQYVAEVLPDRAQPLAQPIASGMKSFTQQEIDKAMQTQAFLNFWQKVNTGAHGGIVKSIENAGKNAPESGDLLYFNGNQLMLNLQPVYANITDRLKSRGLNFVDKIAPDQITKQVEIAKIQQMPAILLGFKIINRAGLLMLIPALIFGVVATLVAKNRRKLLIIFGLATIVLLICGVQAVYLAQYPFMQKLQDALQGANTASAQAIYSIYTRDLVMYNRIAIVLMALMVLFAYLSGQGRVALWLRMQTAKLFNPRANSKYLKWLAKNTNMIITLLIVVGFILILFPLVHSAWYLVTIVFVAGALSILLIAIRASVSRTTKTLRPGRPKRQ